MALTFQPRVGQVIICDYGSLARPPTPHGHISPEMVKRRLVVVMNSKHSGGCVVVPLSATHSEHETRRGYHIEVRDTEMPDIVGFPRTTRWAKCNMIQMTSKERLERAQSTHGYKFVYLDPQIVEQIQRGIIKVIGAKGLLVPEEMMLETGATEEVTQPLAIPTNNS